MKPWQAMSLISIVMACHAGPLEVKPSGKSTDTDVTDSSAMGETDCLGGWFHDADGDGYGDPNTEFCQKAKGRVTDNTDCDDTNAEVHPNIDEQCNGIDDDCDGDTDEYFADLNGDEIPDCQETLVFCQGFETPLVDWGYLGDGEWVVAGGVVEEGRGGFYGAVAYPMESFGRYDRFRMEVKTSFTGSLNDVAGLVWDINPDATTYLVMKWDDPNDEYDRHQPPGAMQMVECSDPEVCPVLAQHSGTNLYWPPDGTLVTWSVEVDHGDVLVTWNGQVVFDRHITQAEERGPGRVGLYSNDNDGGVQFDDFCLWITPDV